MAGFYKTGGIYTLFYTNWHLNRKVYGFILYGGPTSDKVHLLNLSAIQLSIYDRYKLLRTIKKLSALPIATKMDGAMLYQIFKRYHPQEIKKCYRTLFRHQIAASALINYGLNKAEDFTPLELASDNRAMYNSANADYLTKLMNLYTGGGIVSAKNNVANSIAQSNTAPITATDKAKQQQSASGQGITQKPKLASSSNEKKFEPFENIKPDYTPASSNTKTPDATDNNNGEDDDGGLHGMY